MSWRECTIEDFAEALSEDGVDVPEFVERNDVDVIELLETGSVTIITGGHVFEVSVNIKEVIE